MLQPYNYILMFAMSLMFLLIFVAEAIGFSSVKQLRLLGDIFVDDQ